MRNAQCIMRNAECGMRNAECGMRNAECGMRNAECMCLRRIVRMTFLLFSIFKCSSYLRCKQKTAEERAQNISSILSKTVLTLYKIRV